MSRNQKSLRNKPDKSGQTKTRCTERWTLTGVILSVGLAIAAIVFKHPSGVSEIVSGNVPALDLVNTSTVPATLSTTADMAAPITLEALLKIPRDQLEGTDIAAMNLLCAEGLSGAENLDVRACLQLLNRWTEIVRLSTEKNFYRFRQNSAQYDNSEVIYRMAVLSMVLKRDLGVRYNPSYRDMPVGWTATDHEFFRDSRNCFLHGVLSPEKYGTCGTLPVLECAIGRRLGYPLKLVRAKRHFFVRWQSADGKVQQNIECAGDGFGAHPDEYYRHWPEPISDEEVRRGDYLKSLSPQEELAAFVAQRGLILMENRLVWPSMDALVKAHQLAPEDNLLRQSMAYYATTMDEQEADYRQDMERQLILRGNSQQPIAEGAFLSEYQHSLQWIDRIKHALKNPLPLSPN